MTDLPRTWAETLDRFAYALGGGGEAHAIATAWVREAVMTLWGADSIRDLSPARRSVALQKTIGTLYALQDAAVGDLAFRVGIRDLTRDAFRRYWNGIELAGPDWRLDPTETDRPVYVAADDFAAAAAAVGSRPGERSGADLRRDRPPTGEPNHRGGPVA